MVVSFPTVQIPELCNHDLSVGRKILLSCLCQGSLLKVAENLTLYIFSSQGGDLYMWIGQGAIEWFPLAQRPDREGSVAAQRINEKEGKHSLATLKFLLVFQLLHRAL